MTNISKYISFILYLIIIVSLFIILNIIINKHSNTFRNKNKIIENLDNNDTYKKPENLNNDPIYLSKVNAADITYLKKQIDTLSDLNTKMSELNRKVNTNTSAIQSLNKSLASTANQSTLDKKTTQQLANSSNMSVDYSKMKN